MNSERELALAAVDFKAKYAATPSHDDMKKDLHALLLKLREVDEEFK